MGTKTVTVRETIQKGGKDAYTISLTQTEGHSLVTLSVTDLGTNYKCVTASVERDVLVGLLEQMWPGKVAHQFDSDDDSDF